MRSRQLFAAWCAVALILVGVWLRAAALTVNRFHPDEALYATLARHIVNGSDPLLAHTPLLVDKPPLAYYSVAAFIALMSLGELTARLPSFYASIVVLALIFRICRQFGLTPFSAIVSLTFLTFSPFAISFSPTVFPDYLMLMGILFSLSAMLSGRGFAAGLWLGLAVSAKQNALFFAPFIVLVGLISVSTAHARPTRIWRWVRFVAAFAAVIALLVLWDIVRQPAPGFWTAALSANNPGRLARSTEVWTRAAAWLDWLQFVTGSRILDVALLLLVAVGVATALRFNSQHARDPFIVVTFAFLLSYLALNWLVAFPILDRYLLPGVPLVAVLAGSGADFLFRTATQPRSHPLKSTSMSLLSPSIRNGVILLTSLSLSVVMLPAALAASRSDYPIGGDHGPNDGIDKVAHWLAAPPYGTVIYSRGLDWLVRYYLFDAYVFPVYLNTPSQFESDLSVFGKSGPPRYLLLSASEPPGLLAASAARAGFQLRPVVSPIGRAGHITMTLYLIQPSR